MPYYYRTSRGGGLLMLILLVLIGVAAIGFWRGWWGMNVATSDADNQKHVNVDVTVNKGRLNADKEQVVQKAEQLVDKAQTPAESKTVSGTIKQLDADHHHLVVRTNDGSDLEVVIDQESKISAGEQQRAASSLAVGNAVTVVYRQSDGVNTATSIDVTQPQTT